MSTATPFALARWSMLPRGSLLVAIRIFALVQILVRFRYLPHIDPPGQNNMDSRQSGGADDLWRDSRRTDDAAGAGHHWQMLFLMDAMNGAQRRIRTTDTRIFSPLLYQLSYLGFPARPALPSRKRRGL